MMSLGLTPLDRHASRLRRSGWPYHQRQNRNGNACSLGINTKTRSARRNHEEDHFGLGIQPLSRHYEIGLDW